jgi:hypothetical protein
MFDRSTKTVRKQVKVLTHKLPAAVQKCSVVAQVFSLNPLFTSVTHLPFSPAGGRVLFTCASNAWIVSLWNLKNMLHLLVFENGLLIDFAST